MGFLKFLQNIFQRQKAPILPVTEAQDNNAQPSEYQGGSCGLTLVELSPASTVNLLDHDNLSDGSHTPQKQLAPSWNFLVIDYDSPRCTTPRDDRPRIASENPFISDQDDKPHVSFENSFISDRDDLTRPISTSNTDLDISLQVAPNLLEVPRPSRPSYQRNFSRPSYIANGENLLRIPDPNSFSPCVSSQRRRSSRRESTFSIDSQYPKIQDPKDPARRLSPKNLLSQRSLFFGSIILGNLACLIIALTIGTSTWALVFVLIVKSKDVLSSIVSPVGMLIRAIYRVFKPPAEVPQKWILSLIPAYSESEEQIVKCILSLRDNGVEPHRQVMCVVLDGKPRDIKSRFTRKIASFERPYVSFKHTKGNLNIDIGFLEDVPVIVIEKKKNGGKKDSLILSHDLFNIPRNNIPMYTRFLREELWEFFLPELTEDPDFNAFDMVFCTDADSIIHKGALASLTNALARDQNSIAACGLVLVELEPGLEWSMWNLYQQFQYSFGQYVRRRAENFWGKVTCLPGCITMIRVRPECAGAIEKYAEAVTVLPVFKHQVQYLGTDRRLTYSLLSQSKKLTTLFVPEAVSETVAPQSLQHYLSQRRRWGSNAYFNNYFYMVGTNMIPITRMAAFIEVLRLSMVYYRFCNTVLLIKTIVEAVTQGTFDTMKLVPLLIISQFPALWFITSVIIEKELRKRAHKLLLGAMINKCVSPFISMTVFYNVASNVGSQVWGISGVTAAATSVALAAAPVLPAVAAIAVPMAAAGTGPAPT